MKQFAVAGMIGLYALAGLGQPASAMQLAGPLSGLADSAASTSPVIRVQANEAGRVMQLEEQIRSLNGRIEEMSFQLLQMQEQIRKFQEDNEFRFQDLENGGGQSAPKKSGALETSPRNNTATATPPVSNQDTAAVINPEPDAGFGTAPGETTLGTIIFDENGNPVASNTPDSQPTLESSLPGVDNGGVAKQPETKKSQTASLDNPGDLYQVGYGHVLSGDYGQAEQEFRDYLDIYPTGANAADASFWMGEAQYSQGKFSDAAKTFLNAHQAHGTSPKAPEMLLKLGMSLAALDNKDTACATLREVNKRYPKASSAVRAKVTSEQKRLAC